MANIPNILKNRKLLLVIVILVVVGGFFIFRKRNAAVEVKSYTVSLHPVIKNISASGETKTSDELVVRSKIAGKIASLGFKSGEVVKSGDVVVKFDTLSVKAALDTAWQAYSASAAVYSSFDEQLAAYEAAVTDKKLARDSAEEDYRGDSSPDNKQTYKTAVSSYETAIYNLQAYKDKKQSLNEQVSATLSSYLLARDNFNAGIVKAPADGFLALHDIHQGDQITVGQKLFSISGAKMMMFTAEVDEADIESISIGQKVKVSLEGYQNKDFPGTITLIDSITKITSSGSNIVNVEVSMDIDGIKPIIGMTGTASIEIGREETKLAIPFDSVISGESNKNFVYVIKGDKVSKREVQLGFEGDEYYVVKEGVSEGENIVYGINLSDLTDGAKISVNKN